LLRRSVLPPVLLGWLGLAPTLVMMVMNYGYFAWLPNTTPRATSVMMYAIMPPGIAKYSFALAPCCKPKITAAPTSTAANRIIRSRFMRPPA
ncbi:MAG: hypothetical protein WA669_10645, partial [Pseudolabrys sp.]